MFCVQCSPLAPTLIFILCAWHLRTALHAFTRTLTHVYILTLTPCARAALEWFKPVLPNAYPESWDEPDMSFVTYVEDMVGEGGQRGDT